MFNLKIPSFVKASSKDNRLIYSICLIYLIVIAGFMLWHRLWFSPDHFFLFASIAAISIGSFGRFLKDWIPFVLLFLSYEYLRGLAPILNKTVHIYEMINIDKFIFGSIPTVFLQDRLFHSGSPQWYDFLSIFVYMLHFIVPMLTAFLFWILNKKRFREYTLALIILSFAAFATYVIFPAMPPWMASDLGYIPHIEKIMDVTFLRLGQPLPLPTAYYLFRGDPVAAMPSLHAAYPLLTLLFFVRHFKKAGYLLFPYVFGVWFALVYLGEHYVIDIAVGALYTVVIFIVVIKRETLFKFLSSINITKLLFSEPAIEN